MSKNILNTNKAAFYSIIFITFLISVIAYRTYFENGWYAQDDYFSIELGGAGSIFQTTEGMTRTLYSAQGRFQPVRIFLFSAATHLFQEESAVYYNFGLHLANLLLLFFLLRKFSASLVNSLIIALGFSLFGRYRMMEGSIVMIGGSGLNLFFILITLIFLIKALEECDWNSKKIVWFVISIASYVGLVFSYEVAFPLILAIIYTYIIFQFKDAPRSNPLHIRRYFPLLAYLTPLFIYLIFFRHTESSYGGAKITWSYDIILTHLKNYLIYTFTYPVALNIHSHPLNDILKAKPVAILFLVFYFFAIILALKADKSAAAAKKQLDGLLDNCKLLAFGVIFYFSSLVLFILNQLPPIMTHHTYWLTAGSVIIVVYLINGLQYLFPEPVKKAFYYFIILVIAPLILATGLYNTLEEYKKEVLIAHQKPASIKMLKYNIQSAIKDPTKIDAILIKNFFHGYYGINGMDGAYLQWFGFKKYINSGREITSVLDNKIKFRGPLAYHHPPNEEREADNGRIEIFYLNDAGKKLLAYSDFINFLTGENLHQLDQVMSDSPQCDKDYILDAILKNIHGKDTLVVSLDSEKNIKNFLKEASIEINGRAIKNVSTLNNEIYIRGYPSTKYIFLKIVSVNNKFKEYLREIKLGDSPVVKSTEIQIKESGIIITSPVPGWEWGNGFYGLEEDATHKWRWASPNGEVYITNTAQQPLKITFEMDIKTPHKETYILIIKSRLFNDKLEINNKPRLYTKTLIVPSGKHLVKFESNAPRPVGSDSDPRLLSYEAANFKIMNCASK